MSFTVIIVAVKSENSHPDFISISHTVPTRVHGVGTVGTVRYLRNTVNGS